jgi:hypothetical protein
MPPLATYGVDAPLAHYRRGHVAVSIEESETGRQLSRRTAVEEVFTPATPIQTNTLFAGRAAQVDKVYSTMHERGRHAILYGERGVGKTSLANIVGEKLILQNAIVCQVSADSDDSFSSLWRKIFNKIVVTSTKNVAGFLPERRVELTRLSEQASSEITTDVVVDTLSRLPLTVVMIDEFDRVESTRVGQLIADTIKALSDRGTGATILIVGVAADVSELIGHHPSIERSIRQIYLQRMAPHELEEILDNGLGRLELRIRPTLKRKMVTLSNGFPHYTHVLGRYAAFYAVEHSLDEIDDAAFYTAVKASLEDTYHSVQEYYNKVLSEGDSRTLQPLLLAAAVAPEDESGAFYSSDLKKPLRTIKGKPLLMLRPLRHYVDELALAGGGSVLERIGRPKSRRYRFRNPVIKPYIIMRAYRDGVIGEDAFDKLVPSMAE